MTLQAILKQIKYQDKFDYHESSKYNELLNQKTQRKDFFENMLGSGVLLVFIFMVLNMVIFNSFSFFSLLPLGLGIGIVSNFIKPQWVKKFNQNTEQHHQNFSASLFQYLSVPDHLAVLFKALESSAHLKSKYTLIDSFFNVKSLLAETASCDIKNKKRIEDKIISELEPLFHDFLKHQKDNEQLAQHQFELDQKNKNYQAAIEGAGDTDDLMFSTHPPLRVNSRH